MMLAPKVLKTQNAVEPTGKKRLVPKKSKLQILPSTPFASSSHSFASANTNFSDVVRCISGPHPFFGVFFESQRRVRTIRRPNGRP